MVAVETVAVDWAAGNGIDTGPAVTRLASPAALPVTRLSWSAPHAAPAELHRVEGGSHGWPGGPQYLPARLIEPIAPLDATGLVLELAGA